MDDKFELVKKYNIDVDVYIDRDGTTSVGKLSDRNLTKEFLRLYFMGHIAKVWKVWLTDIYGSNNRRKRNLSTGNQYIF